MDTRANELRVLGPQGHARMEREEHRGQSSVTAQTPGEQINKVSDRTLDEIAQLSKQIQGFERQLGQCKDGRPPTHVLVQKRLAEERLEQLLAQQRVANLVSRTEETFREWTQAAIGSDNDRAYELTQQVQRLMWEYTNLRFGAKATQATQAQST